MLEKSHGFCLKCIQCISKYTRTDICVSRIGSRNICLQIEQRKLLFSETHVPSLHISRSIFLYRIVVFYHDKRNTPHYGCVPEIVRLLRKYLLEMYLLDFMQTGIFPHKHQWKKLVHNVITGKTESEWYSRMFENICLIVLLNRFIVNNAVEHLFTTCQSIFEQRSLLYSLISQKWDSDTIINIFNPCPRMKVISLLTDWNECC